MTPENSPRLCQMSHVFGESPMIPRSQVSASSVGSQESKMIPVSGQGFSPIVHESAVSLHDDANLHFCHLVVLTCAAAQLARQMTGWLWGRIVHKIKCG